MRIRVVPTGSGKQALQVVSKRDGVLTVHKHVGSFESAAEKAVLVVLAHTYIQDQTQQSSLFDPVPPSLDLNQVIITKSRPLYVYSLLSKWYAAVGLTAYPDELIKDLVLARIYRPASKLETQEILAEVFNRRYSLRTIYRHLKSAMNQNLKHIYQQALINFAKQDLHDTLQLLFYDVTTLAFDSQAKSNLKDFGFSKDHRHQDAQIVVGLVVNQQGFPLYFEVFAGNTFEGHTFVGTIKNIMSALAVPKLIVVADAAMISKANMEALTEADIGFIVGARLSNLPTALFDTLVVTLPKVDGATHAYPFQTRYRLICHYSSKRAAKDKSDRLKQLTRAHQILQFPDMVTRRYRFLKKAQGKFQINQPLVAKAEQLAGIKGYVTNTGLDEATIIERYHDLWRIEKDFRITKSDLEARPIFHYLDDTIMAHMIVVFAALAICRYGEIKTGMSIKQILKIASQIQTHTAINQQTGQTKEIVTTIMDPILKEKIDRLNHVGD